jgi:shikimate dehydrogenase
MRISAKTKICMIIGSPVSHSLSPLMHNAAYKALNIDDQFVFVASHVNRGNTADAVSAVKALGVRGLTCTIPHKIDVMPYLDEIDDLAESIGAVNTVVNTDGVLKGYNTDSYGITYPLGQVTNIKGKNIVIIGAGGAARAAAFGVAEQGANVTVINRTKLKAEMLADMVGGEGYGFDEIERVKSANIIINTSALGMGRFIGKSPVPAEFLTINHIVFDAVYKPRETKLIQDAKKVGATIIYGSEMLLYQGVKQFELYTGITPDIEVMRKVLIT